MRTLAIVGAGQAGLQLAIGLRQRGYSVKLFTNRTIDQVQKGKIMSSQGMFHSALQGERKLGIDFWQKEAPQHKSVTCTLVDAQKNNYLCQWQGKTTHYYQSIDQRIKFSCWMKEFELLGGEIIIDTVNVDKLNDITIQHDLTVVAAGKNEISQLFSINKKLSIFDKPQRILSCIYVNNTISEASAGMRAYIIPGIGEFFTIPGLTFSGWCEMMLFEGVPGGDFDCWTNVKNINEQYRIALNLLKRFIPYEAKRFENAKPTDDMASLMGAYIPIIRNPISKMLCGKSITTIGDGVVLNDPIAGQGANSAAKAADLYMRRIIEHGKNEFDEDWMQRIFEEYWNQYGKWATSWSNLLLKPPEPHVIELLIVARKYPEIANKLANGFNDPSTLFPWITDAEQTSHFIRSCKNTEMSNIKADDIYFS